MNKTYDQSYLDRKYFIDKDKYNCPFCNRHSVTYSVIDSMSFNWSQEVTVFGYKVQCGGTSCGKTSFHLSRYRVSLLNDTFSSVKKGEKEIYVRDVENLDDLFFYHQPTTFFTLDTRIKKEIRELISEAEGCAKMSYLVGASGCLRKAIYIFLKNENTPLIDTKGQELSYEDKIKFLKSKYPFIPQEYFDALSNIQDMASKQLHEGEWGEWTQNEFQFILGVTKEILTEIYVTPEEKSSILKKILSINPVAKEVPKK